MIDDLQDAEKTHVEMLKLTMCNIISIIVERRFIKSLVGNGSDVHVVFFIADIMLFSYSIKTKANLSVQFGKLSVLARKYNMASLKKKFLEANFINFIHKTH